MAQPTQTVNISTLTILKIVGILLILQFLYVVRDVALVIFVALVLAAAIDPSITRLERRGIPRAAGIAIIYVGIVAVLSLIVILFVPLVVDQLAQFTKAFPQLYEKGFALFQNYQDSSAVTGLQRALESLTQGLSQFTQGIFTRLFSFFGGLLSFIGVLVLTFYLTMEEKGMKRLAVDLAPARHRPYLTQLFNRIEDRLGSWLRGQLLLGLIIAVLTYLGLSLLQVKFALVLALIAGVTELIPIVGPLIGAIPAIIVALSQDPLLALWVLILYIVIQQLENNLIVPKVMSRATGLNPVIVIIAILIGAKLAGLIGIILAVPTIIIITTFLGDFLEEKKVEEARLETPKT
ncbi:MAG: AI-2E family transporter [Candidatus Kerfeldbacteria bacterium]|nr:AI-2E family transporter [Candidatus Kerfeldbacteria bacterium]